MSSDRDNPNEPLDAPEPQPKRVEGFRVYQSGGSDYNLPLKAKLIFWGTVAGGIAVGTFLFLFFVTLFTYLFLPLLAVFFLYQFFRRLKK